MLPDDCHECPNCGVPAYGTVVVCETCGYTEDIPSPTTDVLDDVLIERESQDMRWGVQRHSPIEWIAIIGEEYGESAQEAVKARFSKTLTSKTEHLKALRTELIQLAAVTVAAIESLDDNELRGK